MFKKILLLIMIIGIILIVVSLYKKPANGELSDKCKNPKIVYRYIPRTAEEDKAEPIYVSDVFKKMFDNPSPWVRSINDADYDQMEKMNKFFISQS
jgi:hypothetical protein